MIFKIKRFKNLKKKVLLLFIISEISYLIVLLFPKTNYVIHNDSW